MRKISDIAVEIALGNQKIPNVAKPYLDAMGDLSTLGDSYGMDSGSRIVATFLSNAGQWQGDMARRIKKELNAMLKDFYAQREAA